MPCSPSSAGSVDLRRNSVCAHARSTAARLSANCRNRLREQRAKVSRHNDTGKAIDYLLKRWDAFTRVLDDGRLCLSNNAAERELRAVAVGRKNWTFAGSDEGGRRAAAIYTLIATAKLNDIDQQAWPQTCSLVCPITPAKRIDELLPWNWCPQNPAAEAA